MKLIPIIVLGWGWGLGLGSFVPPVASADTVKGALCELIRLDPPSPSENFTCSFSQYQGNAYINSRRWKFAFPAAEQDETYRRQNTEDFIRFIRGGQYALTIFQSGEKPIEPGGF